MTLPDESQHRNRTIDFGDLRRLQPIDADFGGGRGRPVDRYYIENFLQACRGDIRGAVLEVGDAHYTRTFGASEVVSSDVLHRDVSNPQATLVGDLRTGKGLPETRFDCFICTQTLQYVFEPAQALATIHRILRPAGVLLLSVPGISQISPYDRDRWGEHWRYTPQSVERLLREAGFDQVQVEGHGNVLVAMAFLQGLACEDLAAEELAHRDDRYPLLITARAVKPARRASGKI